MKMSPVVRVKTSLQVALFGSAGGGDDSLFIATLILLTNRVVVFVVVVLGLPLPSQLRLLLLLQLHLHGVGDQSSQDGVGLGRADEVVLEERNEAAAAFMRFL